MATIEERLKILELEVALLKHHMAKTSCAPTPSVPDDVASDKELDGKYGNEPVRKDPSAKYWTGQSYVGRRLSECPPDYLDAMAKYQSACAFMNEKSGDPERAKFIVYNRLDAARARGWAARIRASKTPSLASEVKTHGNEVLGAPPQMPAMPIANDYGDTNTLEELPF